MSGASDDRGDPERVPERAPGETVKTPGAALVGAVVDGKYEVLRVLGEGGMGIVYLARDIHAHAHVVLKAIRGEYVHRKDFRDRILAEGRALAVIDHPNVVRLNAIVVERDDLFLVMQYVDGESLEALIARHTAQGRPIPLREAFGIFRQVVEGVAAAHQEGIIHRDLKPANILIRARDKVVKVTDFGIAKAEEDAKEGRGQTKGTIGSAYYMAPEQCTGSKSLDKRVDIYALGIVLFELLTGRVPFDAPSSFEVMTLQVNAELPRLSAARPDAPPAVEDLLRRACAKKRDDRFASAEEFLTSLDRVAAALPVDSPVKTVPGPAPVPAAMSTVPGAPLMPPLPQRPLSDTEPEGSGVSRSAAVALILAAVVGSVAAAYAFGLLGDSGRGKGTSPSAQERATGASSTPGTPAAVGTPSNTGTGASAAPPKPADAPPPARLAGVWKSDSGRIYDVVWTEGAFEFRIRDITQFPEQGYEVGEPRFLLRPIPDEVDVFFVEDRIRPYAPEGSSYDPARSRMSCRTVWTEIQGRPLRAELDGDRLRVRMVKLEPTPAMFEREGARVVGCKGLSDAHASEIDSTLLRQR